MKVGSLFMCTGQPWIDNALISSTLIERLPGVQSMIWKTFGLVAAWLTTRPALTIPLYVANYDGRILQLYFSQTAVESSIIEVANTTQCGLSPSWLEIEKTSNTLFCSNEAYTVAGWGSLSSFSMDVIPPVILGNSTSNDGPVSSVIYGPHRIALAHYGGSAVSVFDFNNMSSLYETQQFHYTMTEPGLIADRQDAPHPHQILPDPTGHFLVAPDLGTDLLRIYSVDADFDLVELESFSAIPGSGPRHGAFIKTNLKTFYYLLGELANSLTGYEVKYENDTLSFDQVYIDSTFQSGFGDGAGMIAPAEIYAPDSSNLVISTRNDSKSTFLGEPSDTILSYGVDAATGNLTLRSASPAGGMYPRSFSINKKGDFMAVATQYSGRVAVFERNTTSGVIAGTAIASWTVDGQAEDGSSLVHVIWDD